MKPFPSHRHLRNFICLGALVIAPILSSANEVTGPSPDENFVTHNASFDPWAGVTDATKLICGGTPYASYTARIRAVRLIGNSIPSNDFSALVTFLEKNPKDDPAPSDALDAIRNDVAGRLLQCDHLPDDFSRRFLAMANAPHVGSVWQNYTVQFLDALWRRENDPAMRRQIYNTLITCTYDKRVGISGTALLTLSRLPPEAGISQRELGNLAMRIVESDTLAWQDKTTALQVAARSGDARALMQARAWATAEKCPVMLRMSAFAVLGMMGDESDKPSLERYAKTGEFRLRNAAQAALRKVNARASPAAVTGK